MFFVIFSKNNYTIMTAVIFEKKKSLHFIHVVMPICEQFSELNTLSDLIILSFLFLLYF